MLSMLLSSLAKGLAVGEKVSTMWAFVNLSGAQDQKTDALVTSNGRRLDNAQRWRERRRPHCHCSETSALFCHCEERMRRSNPSHAVTGRPHPHSLDGFFYLRVRRRPLRPVQRNRLPAIQPRRGAKDCFVASAPRNDSPL